jgi:ABC-type phosphate/phosphonate transport system substrate-binding protein
MNENQRIKMDLRALGKRGKVMFFIWLVAVAAFPPVLYAADGSLSMGVFPRRGATETAKAFTPMADYLGERLGRKVKGGYSQKFRRLLGGRNAAAI